MTRIKRKQELQKNPLTKDDSNGLGDVKLVVVLALEHGHREKRAIVSRLVPPDRVVVDIHLPQVLHHLNLVLLSSLAVILLLVLRVREAVGDFQHSVHVKSEHLPTDKSGERLSAVLHNLHHNLDIDVEKSWVKEEEEGKSRKAEERRRKEKEKKKKKKDQGREA